MSHFPSMFKSPKEGMRSWLLQVNDLGDLVVYSLDKAGDIENFVSGGIKDVIMSPVKTIHRYCKLEIIEHPDHTFMWGFHLRGNPSTWEAVRRSLVGKPSMERRDNRRVFDHWQTELADYLTGRYWGDEPTLALTPKAIQADAERIAEWEARQ